MSLSRIFRLLALAVLLVHATARSCAAAGGPAPWPWQTTPKISGEAQLNINAQMVRRSAASNPATLAARLSDEGHWTFVNAAGETFTASSEAEIKRAFDVLLPDIGTRTPAFLLTADSVFGRRAQLAQLPRSAVLSMGRGDETFKLEATGSGATNRLLAQVAPNLLVELTTVDDFTEALQFLRRTMERQRFRIVGLEPGGPRALAATPRTDPATGKPDIDPIDPAFLMTALGSLRGQTAVIVGRPDGDELAFKPASGAERTLSLKALSTAAEAADADLLVIKSASAQQPGGRNWLWQRVEIKGLEQALSHATVGDFLGALGSSGNRLVLTLDRPSQARTAFELRQLPGSSLDSISAARIGDVLSDAVTSIVGNVVHTGAIGNVRSAERHAEFDHRLISFIPWSVQWMFGLMVVLGIAGLPMSLRWWARLWPSENAAEYANRFGYWAARAVRWVAYVVVFMPISALIAAPMTAFAAMTRRSRRASKSASTSR